MEITAQYFDGKTTRSRQVQVVLSPGQMTLTDEAGERLDEDISLWQPKEHMGPVEKGFKGPLLVTATIPQRKLQFIHPLPSEAVALLGLEERWWHRFFIIPTTLKGFALSLVGIALGMYLIFGVLVPAMVDVATNLVPLSWEKTVTESALKQVRYFMTWEEQTGARKKVIQKMEQKLSALPSNTNNYDIKIHMVTFPPIINAMAFPSGQIFLFEKMLEKLETPEQLAALLGHETGHVIHRDGMRRLVRDSLMTVLIQLMGGDMGSVAKTLGAGAETLMTFDYSRAQETEADEFGVQAMEELNIHPQASVELMSMLLEVQKQQGEEDAAEKKEHEESLREKTEKKDGKKAEKKTEKNKAIEAVSPTESDKPAETPSDENPLRSAFSTHPEMVSRIQHLKKLVKASPPKGPLVPFLSPKDWKILKKKPRKKD